MNVSTTDEHGFAIGDPLAELARLVDLEPTRIVKVYHAAKLPADDPYEGKTGLALLDAIFQPPVLPVARAFPADDLEDALLAEFERYDTPRPVSDDDFDIDAAMVSIFRRQDDA